MISTGTKRFAAADSGHSNRRESSVHIGSSLLAFVCVFILAACGGGGGSTTVNKVTITPTSITVPLNTSTDFTAVVTLNDSTVSATTSVTWEVNGVAGGNSTVGTIVPSSTDALVGVYTAPPQVPTTSSGTGGELVGQVDITAVAQQSTSSSSSSTTTGVGTVTSNTAVVTVGSGTGLALTPASANVPAGGSFQFSATLNDLPTAATWTATSSSGGNIGSIDSTGLFKAPDFPPPGGSVTITASVTPPGSMTLTATATAVITYSDASLNGPYAFSYTGNDQLGLLAVAGSFVADGNGHIISGVEDEDSFVTGILKQVIINGSSSTYTVGSDGRGTALISTPQGVQTWAFVLTTNQHALLTRFNTSASGGGTIDQQSLSALTNSPAVLSGQYVFSALGTDTHKNPVALAGAFTANGSGTIPETNSILDVNDNGISGGTITLKDNTLSGSYQFDPAFPGTGRGTLTLTSTTTGSLQYAFYVLSTAQNGVNANIVTQIHLVEIDSTGAATAGDMFAAASSPGLTSATYVFAGGGNSSSGAYADGAVFVANGAGQVSSGTFDANNAGTYNNGAAIAACSYTVDSTTGRIDLELFDGSGTCPSGASPRAGEFAAYATAQGSLVLLELDTAAVSTGLGYQQCGPLTQGCASGTGSISAGSYAINLIGQGAFHVPPATVSLFQPDLSGQIGLSEATTSPGNLDINNFSAVFSSDPVSSSSLGTATNGRGTGTVTGTSPSATYNLTYYLIDDNTALLLSTGSSPVAAGALIRQF
jgi:hypothetical protein